MKQSLLLLSMGLLILPRTHSADLNKAVEDRQAWNDAVQAACALEYAQRPYDLMLELGIPLEEARVLLAEDISKISRLRTPAYQHHDTYVRQEQESEQWHGEPLPPEVIAQARQLVREYKKLYAETEYVINNRLAPVEEIQALICQWKQLKEQLAANALVRRAATVRVISCLARLWWQQDIVDYCIYYQEQLCKMIIDK